MLGRLGARRPGRRLVPALPRLRATRPATARTAICRSPPGTGDEPWLAAVAELAEWAKGRAGLVVALGVDAAAGDPESPLEVERAASARPARCSAASACRPSSSRRAATTSSGSGRSCARPCWGSKRAEPRDRDLARVPAARRRAARVVSVASAGLPRRRHTRGAGGNGLRGRGDAEARAHRGDRGAGARGRLAAPGGLRGAGRRHAVRVRVVRGRPRDRAQGDQGRARPGGTWRPEAARPRRRARQGRARRVAGGAALALPRRARARPARRRRDGRLLAAGRPVLPGPGCARHLRRDLARRGPAVRDRDEGGRRTAGRPGRRERARRPLGAPDPRRRGRERGRRAARAAARRSHDRRRPPRRLVRSRVRRRDRGRGHARARPRHHRGGDPAAAHDRLRLAHRGGVRDRRVGLRLVLRRLVPGRRGAPRVVDRLALLPQRRGLGPPRAVHARRSARARGLGSPGLPAGEP